MNKTLQLLIYVKNANPNGDPLNGNRPRQTNAGLGVISDVCIKRKIRNRLQLDGHKIMIQSNESSDDGCMSIKSRLDKNKIKFDGKMEDIREEICNKFIDNRLFGALIPVTGTKKGLGNSIAITQAVSVTCAESLDIINVTEMQITKSTNGQGDDEKKSSDTMGTKFAVSDSVYVGFVDIPSLDNYRMVKNAVTQKDVDALVSAVKNMFKDDHSSVRPIGSMHLVMYEIDYPDNVGTYTVHNMIKNLTMPDSVTYDTIKGVVINRVEGC